VAGFLVNCLLHIVQLFSGSYASLSPTLTLLNWVAHYIEGFGEGKGLELSVEFSLWQHRATLQFQGFSFSGMGRLTIL